MRTKDSMPLSVPASSVQATVKRWKEVEGGGRRWKERGAVTNKQRMEITLRAITKLKRSIPKHLETSRFEVTASIGVNVTRRTVTSPPRREGLRRRRPRKTPLLKKKLLCTLCSLLQKCWTKKIFRCNSVVR